jgi:hypothetical protein
MLVMKALVASLPGHHTFPAVSGHSAGSIFLFLPGKFYVLNEADWLPRNRVV